MIQMNIHEVNVTSNSSNGIAETSVQRLSKKIYGTKAKLK